MPAYRLYRFGRGGHIDKAEWIAADSDEQAAAFARAKKLPVKCEVWERDRLVAMIPATEGRGS
jgi:hypothetical protein